MLRAIYQGIFGSFCPWILYLLINRLWYIPLLLQSLQQVETEQKIDSDSLVIAKRMVDDEVTALPKSTLDTVSSSTCNMRCPL